MYGIYVSTGLLGTAYMLYMEYNKKEIKEDIEMVKLRNNT